MPSSGSWAIPGRSGASAESSSFTVTTSPLGRRGAGAGLLATGCLLVGAALTAAGASASASTGSTSELGCTASGHAASRVGHIGGIVHAVRPHCQAHNTSDAAIGTPPLLFHGGPMMGTPKTGPLVVTPIYWNPGHPMSATYQRIITPARRR